MIDYELKFHLEISRKYNFCFQLILDLEIALKYHTILFDGVCFFLVLFFLKSFFFFLFVIA